MSALFLEPAVQSMAVGFCLAMLANLLMANSERRPPELRLRINNAILAGITSAAFSDIMVTYGVFTIRSAPAFCALIGVMADARLWKALAGEWLSGFAHRHGFDVPDKFKSVLKGRDDEEPKD